MLNINPNIIKRLSLIKKFYQHAIEYSHKPDPLNSISILMFHDSIELFLVLSAEFLDPTIKKNVQFNEYFEKINQKLNGDQLTQKKSIIKLNQARVSFKHYGTMECCL